MIDVVGLAVHHRPHLQHTGAPLAFSLVAATALGASSVLQHAAAAAHPGLGPVRLVLRLVRTPRWLAGRVADLVALGCQAAALATGPLVLVQAVLACGLLVALALGEVQARRWPAARDLLGGLVLAGGLALLLGVGQPHGGRDGAPAWRWAVALVALGLLVVAGEVVAARLRPARQAAVLGILAGTCFALDAALLKAAVAPAGPWWHAVGRWELYGFLAAAALGNVLGARAFQAAHLSASLPGLTAAEPVVALLLGRGLFHEHLARAPLHRAVALGGLLAVVVGVVVVGRSPVVAHEDGSG